MTITRDVTDEAILSELGARFARARLELNLTQAQLAEQAGVSKRTVERLEAGAVGSQFSGIIRICRVLGLVERLNLLIPEPALSPVEQLKLRGRKRRRASGKPSYANARTSYATALGKLPGGELNETPARAWKWGDET